jgi:quercetin dioxygenase-like cupin family protein
MARGREGRPMTDHLTINPATGERLRWHVHSADTGGRFVRAELWCAPGGGIWQRHVHPTSEERFEILGGRLRVELGRRRMVAGPGEHVVLPAGIPHRWRVEPGEEAHVFFEVDDPQDFEEQIETFFALGRRGQIREGGRSSLLTGACMTNLDTAYATLAPLPVQRALFAVLKRVARITGHHRTVEAARAEARARLAATTGSGDGAVPAVPAAVAA